MSLGRARVLIVGAGGLGSPAATILADSGVGHLTVIDDDTVEASNLHRQILYEPSDVGQDKVESAAIRLRALGVTVDTIRGRLLPDVALELMQAADLVLEGADNFATKFLTADAAALARVPAVQAGAVRWSGWALGFHPDAGGACLRCVFEDIPRDRAETCAEAGVVGPVVGVLGAVQAALAIRLLGGDGDAAGELWSYRGLEGALRASRPASRPGCPICEGAVGDLTMERYAPASCTT